MAKLKLKYSLAAKILTQPRDEEKGTEGNHQNTYCYTHTHTHMYACMHASNEKTLL